MSHPPACPCGRPRSGPRELGEPECRRRCSLTIPGKVWPLAAAELLVFTAHLCVCVPSQVRSSFEGMLEKLELDDDGKSRWFLLRNTRERKVWSICVVAKTDTHASMSQIFRTEEFGKRRNRFHASIYSCRPCFE